MKKICRIRLINWHYFINETINVKGSFLLSGENKSGKSTILDAIQFLLTTDQRRFNKAANEKSKRDLKGYVRCKTGVEGKGYIRNGAVISYAALEFYDDKSDKNFVIGAKIDSPDETSSPTVKWYILDCTLDNINFMTGNRPSMDEQFKVNDRKVALISQVSEAKSQIRRRLGNLNEKFFELIPQSIAFKPMDDVKQFINKFILPEHKIEIKPLQDNIRHLDELKDVMETVATKISQLDVILAKKNDIDKNRFEILVYDIMLKMAEIELFKNDIKSLMNTVSNDETKLSIFQNDIIKLGRELTAVNDELNATKISMSNNDCANLINDLKNKITINEINLSNIKQSYNKYANSINTFNKLNINLQKNNITNFSFFNSNSMMAVEYDVEKKMDICNMLKEQHDILKEHYDDLKFQYKQNSEKFSTEKANLENEIKALQNNRITYPIDTQKLKSAIENEYRNSNIKSDVYVFCDLLEISDQKWQNAIEGYLNSQRFYIIVDPKYYDIAAEVYNKNKKDISSAGLVNTNKFIQKIDANENSLASFVTSNNSYAKNYTNFILGKVVCCENVISLKQHNIAITYECMLYQNYTLRKISNRIYDTPYIGEFAVKRQLEIKLSELKELNIKMEVLKNNINTTQIITTTLNNIQTEINIIRDNINSCSEYFNAKNEFDIVQKKLKEAEQDPSYIDLANKASHLEDEYKKLNNESHQKSISQGNLESNIKNTKAEIDKAKFSLSYKNNELSEYTISSQAAANSAEIKYNQSRKERSPQQILENYSRKKVGYNKSENDMLTQLMTLQNQFDGGNLGIGYEYLEQYINAKDKLERSELIKYESQLIDARIDCERCFREAFLAQLKEQIERAKTSFRDLRLSLKDIYYGEDNYQFTINKNKSKSAFYDMIMSENNIIHEGNTFMSNEFENDYNEQITELFDKLTISDDADNKVVNEYTDYRNYLDYDIKITNKKGEEKLFSNIYADMSGGEAQTPYYVAIAASFAQLYNEDTIKIIILDEAFDKMDDERIESMMMFFNTMNFQIILGAPPSKIEVIGEYTDEVLMAYRTGDHSIVEEYIYDGY